MSDRDRWRARYDELAAMERNATNAMVAVDARLMLLEYVHFGCHA